MSKAIMSLLARAPEFADHGHDGRFTMRQLLAVTGVHELLISKFGFSRRTIWSYASGQWLPELALLATIASVSRQPLHRVIRGQVLPWSSADTSSIATSKIRTPRNWEVLERELEALASGPAYVNLEKACERLNLGRTAAKAHFPDLVARIVQRGKLSRAESSAATKRARLSEMRDAFRLLVAAGVYPSCRKIVKISGADFRTVGDGYKKMLDEEWLRVGGETNLRRRPASSTSVNRGGS
ncbi:hypothetical protein HDG34_001773 [Paraburkholderia sp. HC6.4b]|uniref:hypothetical protein n=1 Tax=unclassified Paraburkholderia TaxID=2615204 RepID=UPI0017906ADA|nr:MULTISPECIES: hypothetical protein [unclassified Paraburkholderia]MBB5407841.1 hypothetical protein [Paraburkholderia sp. HC6.4b]MBB5452146.1 hypothetical protein [Paraburkholderia sp. Kb1A]